MKFNEYFFFTFDFKIKLYTRVFDELVINERDNWFERLNRVTLHSVQGDAVPVSYSLRKEWLLSELQACWYESECMLRENLNGGMSMSVFGIATSSCEIL
jgi:hypothetical protein